MMSVEHLSWIAQPCTALSAHSAALVLRVPTLHWYADCVNNSAEADRLHIGARHDVDEGECYLLCSEVSLWCECRLGGQEGLSSVIQSKGHTLPYGQS